MEKRIALVTGANRGIGFETCRQLARRGFRVALTSRDEEKGREAAAVLVAEGLDVHFLSLDVTDKSEIRELAAVLDRHFGRLDVLINNAAVDLDEGENILSIPDGVLETTMEINFRGPFYVTRALLPLMQRGGYGRIVNISSGYGSITRLSGPDTGAYKMSKVALNAFTRILSDAVDGRRIKVNAVDPGWVRTDMGGPYASRSVEQAVDGILWLAELPADGPTGGFFYDRRPAAW